MNNAKSISTGDSLMKTCTWVLDAIYSCYDCVEFIEQLQLIERELSNKNYNDFHSFTADVLDKVPQVKKEFFESIDLSNIQTLPEEYSNTPIYSSIQLRKESKMYTVNIKSHQKLHSSIYTATNNLHRLYVKDKKFVLEARDSVYSIVSLFFDVQTQISNENQEITCIKAKVATVHILGEYHPTTTDQFDGWIKIKIVQTNYINTKLPTKLAHRLFDKREQIIRKIVTKQSENNELTRRFIQAVMNSHTEHFENNNSIPMIENIIGKENSKDTPKTKSDRKLSKGSTSTTNENQSLTPSTSMNPTANSMPKPIFNNFWAKLENFSYERNAEMVHQSKYSSIITRNMDASGYFKHVYFTKNDVLQVFQRSTASQRVVEIASLLALKDQPCIGRIKEVIYTDTEIIGLTMDRYDMTLKDYLHKHTHRRLTGEERMHIITQMLKSINVSHQAGIAHRDLSTVNFMMNKDDKLYLIDFGKAVFFFPRDAKKWWVDSDDAGLYQEDVKPATREELAVWCRNLPYVMARPDHGYRFYRSIQTLPRSQRDHELLTHLIDPAAEDIFSLGTMVWKIFSGIEPWPGVFDTDLKHLRETVGKDSKIDHMLDRSMPGPMSKKFLQMFLRVQPQDRKTAANILNWIQRPDVKQELIKEWSVNNGSRRTAARNNVHCKSHAQEEEEELVHPVIKIKLPKSSKDANTRRPNGRPRLHTKEETSDNSPKRPIGRPRKSTPSSSTQPPSENNTTSSGRTFVSSSPAQHHRYVITEDGIKRFARTNIPVGRPKPQTNSQSSTVKQEHHEASLENQLAAVATKPITPEPTVAKTYPSKYVPTGKPRGRPKKKQRPSPNQNKTTKNEINDDTATHETESIANETKKSEQTTIQETSKANSSSSSNETNSVSANGTSVINSPSVRLITKNSAESELTPTDQHEPSNKTNSVSGNRASLINSPAIKLITKNCAESEHSPTTTAKSAMSSFQGSKRPGEDLEMHFKKRKVTVVEPTNTLVIKDKANSKLFIKLPEQPKNLLTKETIELVGRGTLANVREPNKSTKIVRLSSLVNESDRFSTKKISPPPQSPLLSPTSNTSSTAEDISSPPSPLPGKRKFDYEDDDKNTKRRNIQQDQETEFGTDEFDLALYNILQGLGMNSDRP